MFKLSSKIQPNFSGEQGSLLIEFLVALGLFGILLVSGLDVLGPSLKVVAQSKEKETVAALFQKHFEIIRSIRNEDWNALSPDWEEVDENPLVCDGGEYLVWHYEDIEEEEKGLTLEECTRDFDKYTIGITFHDVYRDASGDIIPTGVPSQIDNHTKKVTVLVEWQTYGLDKSDSQSIFLTNWDAF